VLAAYRSFGPQRLTINDCQAVGDVSLAGDMRSVGDAGLLNFPVVRRSRRGAYSVLTFSGAGPNTRPGRCVISCLLAVC